MASVAVAQFSPNGQYLAAGREFENRIELWNLQDGKIALRLPHLSGNISSLHYSPTNDCLMAAFREAGHNRWYPLIFMLEIFVQPLSIHPTLIAYLSHETTQWRYGRSQEPAQI